MTFLESLRTIFVSGDSKSIREVQAKQFAKKIIEKNKAVFDRLADM